MPPEAVTISDSLEVVVLPPLRFAAYVPNLHWFYRLCALPFASLTLRTRWAMTIPFDILRISSSLHRVKILRACHYSRHSYHSCRWVNTSHVCGISSFVILVIVFPGVLNSDGHPSQEAILEAYSEHTEINDRDTRIILPRITHVAFLWDWSWEIKVVNVARHLKSCWQFFSTGTKQWWASYPRGASATVHAAVQRG